MVIKFGKKAVWHGYILALVLGLIVISLSMWFLFYEYFTSEELDWEECRQSIVLRANAPDLEELGTDLKGAFPLKCRTEVVTINSWDEPREAYEQIANAVATGWYMFGRGKFDFVHKNVYNKRSYCMAFARLHYTAEASNEFYELNNMKREDVEATVKSMRLKKKGDELTAEENKTAHVLLDFDADFADYYRKNNVPGSKGTYQEYLPILSKDSSLEHQFLIMDSLAPFEKDTILVYKLGTTKGASGSLAGEVSTGGIVGVAVIGGMILAPFTFGSSLTLVAGAAAGTWTVTSGVNFWGDDAAAAAAIKEAKQRRKIVAVSPDNLNKIECDEYLAIPA